MLEKVNFNGKDYLSFQAMGNAAQFAMPFAKYLCKGFGYDIGCSKKEWSFPGSYPIDIAFNDGFHADNLPNLKADYIFSSHCLEHIENWVDTLNYWYSKLNDEGVLFLYLPDFSQEYWRPWNNKKHKVIFTPTIINEYMKYKGYKNIFVSGIDLNNSFMAVGNK